MARTPRTFRGKIRRAEKQSSNFVIRAEKSILTRKRAPVVQMGWAVKSDLVVSPNPAFLADTISEWILAQHRIMIRAGLKADGSGPQPKMDIRGGAGQRGKDGTRPDTRAFIRGDFADNWARAPIKLKKVRSSFAPQVVGRGKSKLAQVTAEARTTVSVNNVNQPESQETRNTGNLGQYVPFIQLEASRGVTYHYVEGDVAGGIDTILDGFLSAAVDNKDFDPETGEIIAKSAKV